jgi:hypothetical protein
MTWTGAVAPFGWTIIGLITGVIIVTTGGIGRFRVAPDLWDVIPPGACGGRCLGAPGPCIMTIVGCASLRVPTIWSVHRISIETTGVNARSTSPKATARHSCPPVASDMWMFKRIRGAVR